MRGQGGSCAYRDKGVLTIAIAVAVVVAVDGASKTVFVFRCVGQ